MHASVVCRSVAKAAYLIRGMEKRLTCKNPCPVQLSQDVGFPILHALALENNGRLPHLSLVPH